jgi:cell wall-associated NlpC family hydrolase
MATLRTRGLVFSSSQEIIQNCPAGNAVVLARGQSNSSATLTYGAYTVTLEGPQRSFTDPTAAHPVVHSTWVRTLPSPFHGTLDSEWLDEAYAANTAKAPDVLAIAMQYIRGARPIYQRELQIGGDARYGPLVEGKRQEGSDFNDYLGIEWSYEGGSVDRPEKKQFRCLDCSGYMRMIWGYRRNMKATRHGGIVPVSLTPTRDHSAIPRRANEIFEAGPGAIVIDPTDEVVDLSHIRVGDLVFFDADPEDGDRLDHVGMFLGIDQGGRYRFISSRKARNGPTLGDFRGRSVLDGDGLYARSFRAARRI